MLSPRLPPGSATQLASPLLRDQASWQVNMAFYQPGAANAEEFASACRLLRTTDRSIKQIAPSCGFSDPAFFYRVFRRYAGTTPERAQETLDVTLGEIEHLCDDLDPGDMASLFFSTFFNDRLKSPPSTPPSSSTSYTRK